MTRVIVCAVRKWQVPVPTEPKELHELDLDAYSTNKGMFRIESTNYIRFLNKAAVRTGSSSAWSLCTVTEVEETKQILRLVPIMIAMFIPCTVLAQLNTLFVKQGTTLQRHIGPHFQIPPASLAVFVTISMLVSVVLYDRYFVKVMRSWTKNPRGITLLQRIGVGMFLQIIIMLIASLVERRRLNIARAHGLDKTGEQVPVSIFTLLPQFVLMGIADAFSLAGTLEFFYDQAPASAKSLGTSYTYTGPQQLYAETGFSRHQCKGQGVDTQQSECLALGLLLCFARRPQRRELCILLVAGEVLFLQNGTMRIC